MEYRKILCALFGLGAAAMHGSAVSQTPAAPTVIYTTKPPQPSLARDPGMDSSCMRNLTFPRQALRQGVENANTSLRFYVDAEGNVDASQTVAETTGGEGLENLFNEAAVQALSGCKFTPGTDGTGKPVGRRVRRTVSWRLDG